MVASKTNDYKNLNNSKQKQNWKPGPQTYTSPGSEKLEIRPVLYVTYETRTVLQNFTLPTATEFPTLPSFLKE